MLVKMRKFHRLQYLAEFAVDGDVLVEELPDFQGAVTMTTAADEYGVAALRVEELELCDAHPLAVVSRVLNLTLGKQTRGRFTGYL